MSPDQGAALAAKSSTSSSSSSSKPAPAPASATASTTASTSAFTQGPPSVLFPPTPSRTTSKLSIASVDVHLSPPSLGRNVSSSSSSNLIGSGNEQGSPRRRAHSTPKSQSGTGTATALKSASREPRGSGQRTPTKPNSHGYQTPTKSTPTSASGSGAASAIGSGPGSTVASGFSAGGLLNADLSSPALRARASTASSRAGSIYDDLPSSTSSHSSDLKTMGELKLGESSTSTLPHPQQERDRDEKASLTRSSSSTTSSGNRSKGKHKQRQTDLELESRNSMESNTEPGEGEEDPEGGGRGAGGEMSLSTGDLKENLRTISRRDTVTFSQLRPGSSKRHNMERSQDNEGKGEQRGGAIGSRDQDRIVTDNSGSQITNSNSKTAKGRLFTPRKYYVLTHAGKPVFCSHENPTDEITNLMGIAQALISIFAEEDDRIRCIIKGSHRIAFLLKAPLYLFCVSDWGEPEHVLRSHLEYIHLQILSVVSSTQLSRVFQRRSNFDLSRLLDGTETFLNKLIDRAQYDFSYLTSTLQPLRMNPAVRDNAAAALMPPSKFKDLLYVLLVADGHIVTLLRPRKHSIHPSDLHLLLNTLSSSATLRSSETWLPICFPRFNPAGFVHAYVSYVSEDVGLIFVSADREAFEELRGWKEIVLEKLEHDKTLSKIKDAIPLHPYTVAAIGCPGLRHFMYKSRLHVQLTQPEWEAPYTQDSQDQKRLITLYQKLHDAVHARSGQSAPLKLVYMRTEHEACLAWCTKPFELYLTVSPQLSKSAVVAAANAVAKWVLSEEGKVFLKDAPVF